MAAACIVNLEDIREFAREQGEALPSHPHREWLERAVLRRVAEAGDCLLLSKPSRTDLAGAHVADAVSAGTPIVRFEPSAQLEEDVALVVDWLAGIHDRESRLVRKLSEVTFAGALEMSHRWHCQLQKKPFPSGSASTPAVLDEHLLGPGWSWVWLKSPEARKVESEVMGHCVGSGGYESLRSSEAILSLRDPDDVPHVTLHLDELRILQAATQGNGEIPARYHDAVDRAAVIIGVQLLVGDNPERAISDGWHRRNEDVIHVRHGLLHREEGPAIEWADGDKEWYRDGTLHRDSGPAVVRADGTKEWYRGGQLHREDGPAVERADGDTWWYRDGQLHREGGPAIERSDGTKEWYRNGKSTAKAARVEFADGSKRWYRHGKLHREDGPSVEWPDGTKEWYIDGEKVDESVARRLPVSPL